MCFSVNRYIVPFNKDSTPNLRHLIVPMSVDGIASEALIDCDGFEEFTYYNDRIYVCDDAFNPRCIKRMHYPPANMTWNLEEVWKRREAVLMTPEPPSEVVEDDSFDDVDLPF